MTIQNSTLGKRVGATVAAASVLGSLAACGDDGSSGSAKADDAAKTSTPAAGTTSEFKIKDDSAVTTKEYVAAIAGSDIYAAFALSRRSSDGASTGGTAYFCDGKSIATWFTPTKGSGDLTFRAANGATFTAKVNADGTVTATVNLGGKDYQVTAKEVDADGKAGLYLADHAIDADLATDERAGWIVLPDGTQRGAVKATTTVLPGANILDGTSNVVVAGRNVLLRAITHIIDVDMAD